MTQTELDQAMEYLTKNKNIQIKEIVERLKMERNAFNSWRRSSQENRRRELLGLIIGAYPEHFPDGKILGGGARENGSPDDIQNRYISLLERSLSDAQQAIADARQIMLAAEKRVQAVEEERDRLRAEVTELLSTLKKHTL